MKKYIFGLGVMFVGAVLMFVFMGSEVYAGEIKISKDIKAFANDLQKEQEPEESIADTSWWQVGNWLGSGPGIFLLVLFAYSFFKILLYDKQPLPFCLLLWLYCAMDGNLWVAKAGEQSIMHMIWAFPGLLIVVWICYLWKEAINTTGKTFGF